MPAGPFIARLIKSNLVTFKENQTCSFEFYKSSFFKLLKISRL